MALLCAVSAAAILMFAPAPSLFAQSDDDHDRALLAFQTVPGNPGSNFGATLALDGDTVAVGASGENSANNFDTGTVYIYIRSGTQWVLQQSLTENLNVNGLFFGEALALDGDTLAVSSYYRDSSAGAVYIFTRTAGVWTQQAELVASDRAENDLFGVGVALDGDTLAVSAPGADTTSGVDAGAAYIFTRAAGTWTQQTKLLTGTAGTQSGRTLALSAGTLLVGSPDATLNGLTSAGQVSVFTGGGATWAASTALTASDPAASARFGASLSYESGRIAIGAPGLATGMTSGAVYLFAGSGPSWTQQFRLVPNTPQAGQTFGEEVGLNGQRLLVSSPNYDSPSQQSSGAAYAFSVIGTNWVQSQFLTGTSAAEEGYFSAGLAIGPTWSVIGSAGETTSVIFYREVSSGQELLVNGGFELADSTDPKVPLGWTQTNVSSDKRKCDASRAPYQGACTYKFVGRADESSKLEQTIDPTQFTLVAGNQLVLDGFVRASGDDVRSRIKAVVEYPDGTQGKLIAKVKQPTSAFASLSTFSSKLTLNLTQTPTSIMVMIKNRGTSGKVLYDGLTLYVPPTTPGLLPLP